MDVDIEEDKKEQQLQTAAPTRGITPKLLLEFHQTTYNALSAVIRATQTKDNFINVFLFKETWDNIIDLTEKHTFQVETNYAIARQIVTALSTKNQALLHPIKTEGGATASSTASATRGNLRMMSSQFLADSSLGQELTYMGSFFGNKQNEDTPMDVDTDASGSKQQEGKGKEKVMSN